MQVFDEGGVVVVVVVVHALLNERVAHRITMKVDNDEQMIILFTSFRLQILNCFIRYIRCRRRNTSKQTIRLCCK